MHERENDEVAEPGSAKDDAEVDQRANDDADLEDEGVDESAVEQARDALRRVRRRD